MEKTNLIKIYCIIYPYLNDKSCENFIKAFELKTKKRFDKILYPLKYWARVQKNLDILKNKPNFCCHYFAEICASGDFEKVLEELPRVPHRFREIGLQIAIERGLILVVVVILPRSKINIVFAQYLARKYKKKMINKYLCQF